MSRSINFNPLRRPSDTSAGAQPARKTAAHGHDSDQPHRAAGIVIASCISRSSSQAMRFAPGGSLAPCPYTHRRARPASTARMIQAGNRARPRLVEGATPVPASDGGRRRALTPRAAIDGLHESSSGARDPKSRFCQFPGSVRLTRAWPCPITRSSSGSRRG